MSMNIYLKKGTKIIYNNYGSGYPHNRKTAEEHLVRRECYTVDHTVVGSYATDVYLVEVPDIPFNSVMFDAAK